MSNDTCQFYAGVKGDLVCNEDAVDGRDVCEEHLHAFEKVSAGD